MRKIFLSGLLISTTFFFFQSGSQVFGQNIDAIINAKEAERIERVLAADDMKGRKVFSPEIEKAASFIADEFKKAGILTLSGSSNYLQDFAMVRPKFNNASATFDGNEIAQKDVIVVTCQSVFNINQNSGFEIARLQAGGNLFREASKFTQAGKNMLVLVDKSYANEFSRLSFLKRAIFKTDKSVVFVLSESEPKEFTIEARHEITEQPLANVVGILPGKSKKEEYVIFSAHYDHIGTGKPVDGDSIYNGANDDAAGTTAVIMLAKYFKVLGDNERTIVFAAFTAEESGGYGSQYFSRQFDPEKVMAMFNIEMIGTESKWGKNSAYITGFEKTDMGAIMQKNLEGTGFTFYPDPYTKQNLFYRSDNATLARLGVPAHSISTSKMDNEPNYHELTDHIETLDMENMARIIKSIALASRSIVAGKDTPTRVNMEDLR
jgi:hypothetical protein